MPRIRMTEELSVSRTLISPVLKHRGKFSLFLFCSTPWETDGKHSHRGDRKHIEGKHKGNLSMARRGRMEEGVSSTYIPLSVW